MPFLVQRAGGRIAAARLALRFFLAAGTTALPVLLASELARFFDETVIVLRTFVAGWSTRLAPVAVARAAFFTLALALATCCRTFFATFLTAFLAWRAT